MVQILPYIESPLQQLAPHIQQAAGALGTGLGQRAKQSSDASIMAQLENATPMQITQLIPKLSEDKQKQVLPLYSPYLKEDAKTKAQLGSGEGLSDQDYSKIISDLKNDLIEGKAGMAQWLKSFIPGAPGAAARKNTSRFQAQATALLGLAQRVALKQGIRNQREFQTFLDRTIPNKNDTVETAQGKLDALESYLKGGKIPEDMYKPKTESQEKPPLESFYK